MGQGCKESHEFRMCELFKKVIPEKRLAKLKEERLRLYCFRHKADLDRFAKNTLGCKGCEERTAAGIIFRVCTGRWQWAAFSQVHMRRESYEQDSQKFTLRQNRQSEGVSFNLAFNGGSDDQTLATDEYAGPVDKPEPENEPADLENEPAGPVDEPEPMDEPAGPVDEPKTEDEPAEPEDESAGEAAAPESVGADPPPMAIPTRSQRSSRRSSAVMVALAIVSPTLRVDLIHFGVYLVILIRFDFLLGYSACCRFFDPFVHISSQD